MGNLTRQRLKPSFTFVASFILRFKLIV
ncbi:uncharacterized protein METZ01_LOCUS43311 [marine metagenome]|uniref:Uncharacterized protein n=1 Tax=marine metagenome TaxID=408172 RepID=A0A381RKL3_9ZZZZ